MAESLNTDSVEIWKPVPGWEGEYEVCLASQTVRSIDRLRACKGGSSRLVRGRIMKPWSFPSGYINIHLRRSGESVMKYLHQIICEVAHGPRPSDKHCVRHLDGDARNNRPENLAWGTAAENHDDRISHGRDFRGRNNHAALLSEVSVLEIRSRAASGERQPSIARDYGISQTTVSQIHRRVRWGWLKG